MTDPFYIDNRVEPFWTFINPPPDNMPRLVRVYMVRDDPSVKCLHCCCVEGKDGYATTAQRLFYWYAEDCRYFNTVT